MKRLGDHLNRTLGIKKMNKEVTNIYFCSCASQKVKQECKLEVSSQIEPILIPESEIDRESIIDQFEPTQQTTVTNAT